MRRTIERHARADATMSRQGTCWDKAVIERFFRSLKSERTNHHRYSTREAAKQDVTNYIEMFHNSQRLYSYLGYVSSVEYEKTREDISYSAFAVFTRSNLLVKKPLFSSLIAGYRHRDSNISVLNADTFLGGLRIGYKL